jgi:hypothetical protein
MFRFNYLKKNRNSAIWKHQQFGSISRFRFNYIAHEPKKKLKSHRAIAVRKHQQERSNMFSFSQSYSSSVFVFFNEQRQQPDALMLACWIYLVELANI